MPAAAHVKKSELSWAILYKHDFVLNLECVSFYITLKWEKEMKGMRLLYTGAAWNAKCARLVQGGGRLHRAKNN